MTSDNPIRKDTQTPVGGPEPVTSQSRESVVSAAGAAKSVDRAINETAGKYLKAAGIKVDLKNFQNEIRDRPFFYLGIAAGAGFTVGGGMASKLGLALLALGGRRAATETATNLGRQVLREATGGAEASA
jgi:hypothetical protein